VNEALTISEAHDQVARRFLRARTARLARRQPLCHGLGVRGRTTKAGGCFLTISILAGFPLGLAIGNPMKGILIGTAVGAVLALATWLIDRSRRG
jgi:hypothetical protein